MKVFLVDDEIVIREGIRESFPWDETPYDLVGEAPDGEMAIPMIRDTNPDIVITDIKMPFMDGLELCRVLRTQMPWIGIIVLSGYDEFEYARYVGCANFWAHQDPNTPLELQNLHQRNYLFMPNLPGVGQFFHTFRHNFAIDTTLSVIIALIVIGFSCVTSNILRVSPFFKKWLFGR